jgi:hypothetical protein
MRCLNCEMLSINGIACHETGCPDAWREAAIPCFECGCEFVPDSRFAKVCPDCVADAERNAAR